MTAYLTYGLLAFAGMFTLPALMRRRRGSGNLHSARQALAACQQLLKLIGHMQQHRGMSSAFLSGDKSFMQRLSTKRGEIDALFPLLQQAAAEELGHASPCLTPNDLALFRFKWRSLSEGLTTLTVEKSIAEHGQLIATALDWLDALGEARIALACSDRVPAGLMKNFAQRLPALAECLGQARAIGSSAAAQGKCSAVARVRLMFLVSRAEHLLDQAFGKADGAFRDSAATQAAVKALANVIREHMLTGAGVTVTAENYFSLATKAIEGVYGRIEDCGRVLERHLT